jgi:hypothetical protein
MTITEQPPTEALEAAGTNRTPTVPGDVGHPPGTAQQPYWLDRPCPPWCQRGHRDEDSGRDRAHSSGSAPEIELTLEPRVEVGGDLFPAHIGAVMMMHYRDARPHACLSVSDREEVLLELPEARELAQLLADPPHEWASLTLTMMDSDPVMPAGFGVEGRPGPKSAANFAAFPFTRSPVAAVRRVLDSVMVFCPFQTDPYREQMSRYLALTPGEAASLATMIAKLVEGTK